MLPTVRGTWAPKGQTPILRHRTRSHKKVSTIGALRISPQRRRLGLYLHRHPHKNITQDEVILFLRDLLTHLRGNVILVWDRLNAPRSARVKPWRTTYPRLSVEWFPPYAPKLNPMEYVRAHLKYHRLSDHGLLEPDAIRRQAGHEAGKVAERPTLLRSFVHASGLPIRLRS